MNRIWALTGCLFIAQPVFAVGEKVSPISISESDLGRSFGYLRHEPYPIGDSPSSLKVFSAIFEDFRTTSSVDANNSEQSQNNEDVALETRARFFWQSGENFGGEPKMLLTYPETGRVLTIWRDGGFEISINPIAVWKTNGSTLTLEAVLDRALVASIGTASFEEVHRINSKQHLIIGRTGGGDGGDAWESLWAGVWTEPRTFDLIFEDSYVVKESDDLNLRFLYKLNAKTMEMEIRKQKEGPAGEDKFDDDARTWADISTATVKLRGLIPALKSVSTSPTLMK